MVMETTMVEVVETIGYCLLCILELSAAAVVVCSCYRFMRWILFAHEDLVGQRIDYMRRRNK